MAAINDEDLLKCLDIVRLCTQKLDPDLSTEYRLLDAEISKNAKFTKEKAKLLEKVIDRDEVNWRRTIKSEVQSLKQEFAVLQQEANKSAANSVKLSESPEQPCSDSSLETINKRLESLNLLSLRMHVDIEQSAVSEKKCSQKKNEAEFYGVAELMAGFKQILRCLESTIASLEEFKNYSYVLKSSNAMAAHDILLFSTHLCDLFHKIEKTVNEIASNDHSD